MLASTEWVAEHLNDSNVRLIDSSIVECIFRQHISTGKGMGLMSMVDAVRALARRAP